MKYKVLYPIADCDKIYKVGDLYELPEDEAQAFIDNGVLALPDGRSELEPTTVIGSDIKKKLNKKEIDNGC